MASRQFKFAQQQNTNNFRPQISQTSTAMSYSREQIQNIIARNKKRSNAEKSPSPPLSPKSIATAARGTSPKDLALRYQQLCSKYKNLLEDVKDKNHKFELQELELERLRSERERDHKQLYRLRSMIGFIRKEDMGTQVNMDMQSGGSWSTKMEKSTAIEYQQQMEWNTPVKHHESTKLLRKRSPASKQMNTTSANIKSGYKTSHIHPQDPYPETDYSRVKADSIYSPKAAEKQLNSIFKTRESRQIEEKYSKLSNSPYSKLRFSRNM